MQQIAWEIVTNSSYNCFLITEVEEAAVSNKNDWKIYPNPVLDELKINNSDDFISDVKIFDITGRVLKTLNDGTKLIDVIDLSTGIYYVSFRSNGKVIAKKFIKH